MPRITITFSVAVWPTRACFMPCRQVLTIQSTDRDEYPTLSRDTLLDTGASDEVTTGEVKYDLHLGLCKQHSAVSRPSSIQETRRYEMRLQTCSGQRDGLLIKYGIIFPSLSQGFLPVLTLRSGPLATGWRSASASPETARCRNFSSFTNGWKFRPCPPSSFGSVSIDAGYFQNPVWNKDRTDSSCLRRSMCAWYSSALIFARPSPLKRMFVA